MSDFDELPDDVTEEELEGVDLSDPEAIAAFMEGRELPKAEEEDGDTETDTEQDETDGDTSGQAKGRGQETDDSTEGDDDTESKAKADDDEPRVLAADGKSEIPFAVFKGMRDENRDLKRKYAELQGEAEKSKKLQRFLDEKGIDFEDPDAITDRDLEEMAELDPVVGKLGNALRRIMESKQEQPAATRADNGTESNPVEEAIAQVPELTEWRTDPERWKEVQEIDQRLHESGKWEGKPMADRFKEVVRISKLLNGEAVEAPSPETKQRERPADVAAKKVAAATSAKPTSLSNMGKPPATEKTMAERLSALSPDELQEEMMGMTEGELEQAYAAMEQLGM